ncbi:hypothetical protein ACJZ2D_008917 [Fusarium nematophilum]
MFKTLADCMQQGTLLPSTSAAFGPVPSSVLPPNRPPDPNHAHSSSTPPAPTPPDSISSAGTGNPRQRQLVNGQFEAQQVPSPLGQQSSPRDTDNSAAGAPSSLTPTIPTLGADFTQGSCAFTWSPYGTTTGKLVRDDGRQRYVSGTFWEALHSENDMDEAAVSDDESDCDDPPPMPGLESSHYALIFNSCAPDTELNSLHLPQSQRLEAWQLFKANVHPVATILHIPSVEPMVLRAIQDPQNLSPPLEALMFVVYFGAVNSLNTDDCRLKFGLQQSDLLARFRRGVDAALARSRLMATDDMLTLQTFVVYLVVLRSRDPSYSWNMTGLAARLAQSLGMHRDGSTLNLSLFDAEMRRRLWWSICILDTPASEDYSCSPGLGLASSMELSSFNSRPPLNVNDADLHPDMTEYPTESRGMTDMSFTAARCWASSVWRTMIDTRRADPDTGKSFMSMTIAEKEAWVDKQRQEITRRFSGDRASREPLYCLTSAFIGAILSNLRLMVLNPLESGACLDEEQRSTVFQDAIDCMTHSYRLRTDPMVAQWSWLTKCYHEWHAFAIILSELCSRPLARDADKAWRVVEQSAVLRWDSATKHRRVHQWRSVMRNIDKARRRRKKELGRRRSASSTRPSSFSARRGHSLRERLRAPSMTRRSMSYSQSSQNHVGLLLSPSIPEQDAEFSMYQTEEMMMPLLGDEDICNFTAAEDQLYFS